MFGEVWFLFEIVCVNSGWVLLRGEGIMDVLAGGMYFSSYFWYSMVYCDKLPLLITFSPFFLGIPHIVFVLMGYMSVFFLV